MGPVQVLVLGYDQPKFSGGTLAEVHRLEGAGIVRLVDAVAVRREASGVLETLDVEGLPGGAVASRLLGSADGDPVAGARADGWSLADAMPVGAVAIVVLLEHLWATNLVDAIGRAGGRPLDELWLGADDRALLEGLLAERG